MSTRKHPGPLHPGDRTPVSGQYLNNITRAEVTSVAGHPLPPGPAGSSYVLVDRTRHQGDSRCGQ
jgi:hypothetical protein